MRIKLKHNLDLFIGCVYMPTQGNVKQVRKFVRLGYLHVSFKSKGFALK